MPYEKTGMALAVLLAAVASGCSGEAPLEEDSLSTLGTNAEVDGLQLRNVYLEPPPDGVYTTGADATIRLSLHNATEQQDSLTAVESPYAATVEQFWDEECDGAVEQVDAIPVLGDGTVPGARETPELRHLPYYLRMVDISEEIREGTTIPVTFTFQDAGSVQVDVLVQPRGTSDEPAPMACASATASPTPGG